ncbi:MAG: diguanylate cyclase [Actinoplanes sp.]
MEAGQLVARGGGIVLTAVLVAGGFGVFPGGMPAVLVAACLAMIAAMIMSEALGVLNFRRPDSRAYPLRSAVQVTGDLLVMSSFVAGLRIYADTTTWPSLIIPIVVAALRFRLPGALIAWAVTSAFLPFALTLGPRPVVPGELAFAILMHLIVAFISGTQAGAFARQVRELDEARRAMERQAGHDPLTGLPNRMHLSQFYAGQDSGHLAVLLLDLNGFKQVNDAFGHAAGDEVLCETGRRINASLRDGDLAGRLGGDEFLVLLPRTGPEETEEIIQRLRTVITQPIAVDGHLATVGVSIGAADRRAGDRVSLEVLTASADRAMYAEKTAIPR